MPLPSWFLEAMKLHLEAEEARAHGAEASPPESAGESPPSDGAFGAPRSLGACRLHSLSPSSLKTLLYRTLCNDNLEHTQCLQPRRRRNIVLSRDRKLIFFK